MIKLGSTVCDVVSGFTGIAIQRLDQLNGNVQVAIQPRMAEGATTYPEAMFIDLHMIEVIDAGVSDRVTEPVETAILVGQKVRDRVTQLEGIAINKSTFMNGCVSFQVVSKLEKTDLGQFSAGTEWIEHSRLEVIDDGVTETVKPAKVGNTGLRPGGPAQRVERRF